MRAVRVHITDEELAERRARGLDKFDDDLVTFLGRHLPTTRVDE